MIFNSKRRTASKDVQAKKHYSQMDKKEKQECINLIRRSHNKHKFFEITNHAKGKLVTKLDFKSFLGMIYSNNNLDNIIEYSETKRHGGITTRVLVKHPKKLVVNGFDAYLFLVIEIESGVIVTGFYNKANDTHKTIDMSYYQEDLKIIK